MKHHRKIIYLAGFLFSLPIALAAYINSSFIASFVGEKLSSIVYTFGSLTSILGLVLAPKIWKRIGGYKFLLLITFLDALTFLVLAITDKTWIVVITFILGFCFNNLIVFSLDELLKIFSSNNRTGAIRGTYMMIYNLAWILAQLASGTILGAFNFKMIYLLGFVIMTTFLLVSLLSLKEVVDPKYDNIKSLKYIKKFFKEKELVRAYSLSFLLSVFYCWMVIYTPIYLKSHLGFSWKDIGLIFTIMLTPFFFIPPQLGKYADKIGEKKILLFGFIVTTLSTFALFFIQGKILLVWAFLLFMTRVGAATIEVASDSYFFKHIKPENEEFVGVFRSAYPVAYVLGPLVAFIILSFVPHFRYLFIALGILMFLGIYISSTVKTKTS